MPTPNKVVYRGVTMVEGWPEQIQAAQQVTTVVIKGQEMSRIPYGSEKADWGANEHECHDCAVIKGEYHVEHCDAEECPGCGGQRFSCDCEPEEDAE